MKRAAGIAAALASLAAGCGSGASNVSTARDETPPVEVNLRIQNGECRVTLAGEPGDGEALLARAVRVLEDFIPAQEQQYGSVQELPAVQLLGAPDVPWRCVGAAMFRMQQAGFERLLFGAPGAQQIVVDLPVEDPNAVPPPIPPQVNRIGIGQTGGLSWNGVPVTAERLSMHLRAAAAMRPEPELEIDPSPGARLQAVISLLGQVRDAGIAMSRSDQQTAPGTVYDDIGPWGFRFVGLDRFADELK